jgi:hypothetical protein
MLWKAITRSFPLCVLFCITPGLVFAQKECPGQPFIRGLRVFGGTDERNLPLIVVSKSKTPSAHAGDYPFITIRFDVAEPSPPRLKIVFHHCDRDWKIDQDFVVRDDFFGFTRMLFYETSPAGTRHYTYRFTNSFPSKEHPFVRFQYSGNWSFEITEEDDAKTIYATGRFIVVEDLVRGNLQALNNFWTENDPPRDRVHRLELDISVPKSLFADYVETVDFYKNQNLFENYRVKSYDFTRNTRVDGIGMREKTFTYMNVLPGNGYRVFDITALTLYPSDEVFGKAEGPDFTRYRFGTSPMRYFGSSETMPAINADADYSCVRFELATPEFPTADVFVAGIFNNWDPQLEDRMHRDPVSGNYVVEKWLFRGAYDYQYVVGVFDPALGYVTKQDWIALEGNDWDAGNLYWAIVYYSDDQFGGITRAVGFALRYPRYR